MEYGNNHFIIASRAYSFQSALIPNCDALKIKPCTVIIHAGYTTEIKDSR